MKGKYVFIGGEEYYNYGEIEEFGEGYILVRLRSIVGPPSLKLFTLNSLSDNEDVFFFNYEEELRAWLEWLETPGEETEKFKLLNFKKDK